jgi:hypothetical protein
MLLIAMQYKKTAIVFRMAEGGLKGGGGSMLLGGDKVNSLPGPRNQKAAGS